MSARDPSRSIRGRTPARIGDRIFVAVCAIAAALPLVALVYLVLQLLIAAAPRIGWSFIVGQPALDAHGSGILPALAGSVTLVALTALIALPVGLAAGIYLAEYAHATRLTRWTERNIAHLAAVPSVVYGLVGLVVFVRTIGFGRSLLAGAATLALTVLPKMVITTRDAMRRVPRALRQASYALGATRWRTIRHVVLPMAMPTIIERAALSVARAIGEASPLLVVGALGYGVAETRGAVSGSSSDSFTALPVQVWAWLTAPDQRYVANAAAGMIVLLVLMLLVSALGVYLRRRMTRAHEG
ncbi:MAG: phosphate ABC transporter permease PstA [Myxococcales bacterium]|nr:phosphate ABC transporter permease PstA [Myxococcales bacterium]